LSSIALPISTFSAFSLKGVDATLLNPMRALSQTPEAGLIVMDAAAPTMPDLLLEHQFLMGNSGVCWYGRTWISVSISSSLRSTSRELSKNPHWL
jgi:hypothetical protein